MKHPATAISNPVKTKVSIRAKAIIVFPNKLSYSSGFRATARLKDANRTPTPRAAKATGNMAKESKISLNAVTSIRAIAVYL